MFRIDLFLEIIVQVLRTIVGVKKFPSRKDIKIEDNVITINLELDKEVNVYQLSLMIEKQLKYKLIDNTDNKKLSIHLNIVNL